MSARPTKIREDDLAPWRETRVATGLMRFELLDGSEWRGNYATRRAAMADAELFAAKRGHQVRWARTDSGDTVGHANAAAADAVPNDLPFTVRERAGVKWAHSRRGVPYKKL